MPVLQKPVLISSGWRQYRFTADLFSWQSFCDTQTTWDFGSASWSCLTQFSFSCQVFWTPPQRCHGCYFWLWQQVMAQHHNTWSCQQHQTFSRGAGLRRQSKAGTVASQQRMKRVDSGFDLLGLSRALPAAQSWFFTFHPLCNGKTGSSEQQEHLRLGFVLANCLNWCFGW